MIEIVLDIISKPKMRQQTLRVPMQTSNCLFVNKLTTITYMFPSNLINHIAVLQKNTKKCQKIIKFLSMSKNTQKLQKCNCFTLIFLRYLQVPDPLLVVLVDMYQFAHCCVGFYCCLLCLLVRTYMYMCAHKKTGCKGTKKFWHIQMYMQKNEIFLNFVRGMGGFEGIEWMDSENYSDDNATRRL